MHEDRHFQDAQQLHRKGQLAKARQVYELILRIDPSHGPARLFRALILQQAGQSQDAVSEARRAMADLRNPNPSHYVNFGVLLKNAGLLGEAEAAYREGLSIEPDNLAIKANLGTLLLMGGRLAEAEAVFLELSARLEDPGPLLNLARVALLREQHEPFEHYLRQAEDLEPKHPDIPLLRARQAAALRDDVATFEQLKILLARRPAHAEGWLMLQKLETAALELDVLAQVASQLADTEVQLASLLAYAVALCRQHLIWEPLPRLEAKLARALEHPIDKALSTSATFTLLSADVSQAAHRRSAEATWRAATANVQPLPPRRLAARQPGQRIKVAIMSSDLRQHAGGTLLVGLIEQLRHAHIEWYAYSNSFDDASAFRSRLRRGFDRFINVVTLNDRELAEKIRADGIDLLIDRNGMTRDSRVLVTAYRPAPIQMTFLAMPGSVGAEGDLDYLIGDPWVTTAENRAGFSEHILRLPRCYQPNDHQPPDRASAGTRAEHRLPDAAPVLCCFNQYYKFSPDTFALWARILHQVPDAVLWLLDPRSEAIAEQMRGHWLAAGLDPARLILAPRRAHREHIARIGHADLVLDTWPYNAHTTASDALRVGVPVVTLPGHTFAARVAASILSTCQLPDWIASDAEDYVAKAVAFARQPRAAIEATKAQVHATYWASPMVDNQAFAEQFEAMCLQLYDRHAAGEPPTDLQLNPDLSLTPLSLSTPAEAPAAAAADSAAAAAADSAAAAAPDPAGAAAPDPAAATAALGGSATSQAGAAAGAQAGRGREPDTATGPGGLSPATATADSTGRAPLSSLTIAQQLTQQGGEHARLQNLRVLRDQVIGLGEPPLILDIGAQGEQRQAYDPLVETGLVRLLGLEPDARRVERLSHLASDNRQYRHQPLAAEAGERVYYRAGEPALSGLKAPDPRLLVLFRDGDGRLQEQVPVQVAALDSLSDLGEPALLRLNVQGAEREVLQGAAHRLGQLGLVQLRAAVLPLHREQASWFAAGQQLEQQGFLLHSLLDERRRTYKSTPSNDRAQRAQRTLKQLSELEGLFIRTPLQDALRSAEQRKQQAFLLHALYGAYDLTLRLLEGLDLSDRGQRAPAYAEYLEAGGLSV